MGAKQVVVGCAADGGYALPLAVMLRSVAAHLDARLELVVYAVDAGLAAQDRDRIARSLDARTSLVWVAPERSAFTGLPLWGRMPIATYDKLAIARWIPATEARVLWLDADLLVLGDLAELWRTDLHGAVIGASPDARVTTVGARFGIRDFAALGLASGDKYFNAGVMLVDLDRWRTEGVEERALDYLKRNRSRVYFWDQEALNAALSGRWHELAPCWNWTPNTGVRPDDPHARTSVAAPAILHFSGNLKPWRYAGSGAAHDLYYRTLDDTAWAGFRPAARLGGRVLAHYESSALRRFALPLERCALTLLRAATLRYASAGDLAVTRPAPTLPPSTT